MTLYWWNHWFWITVVSVFATLPFTSVATYPISSPSLEQIEDTRSSNQNDNKHSKLPLEFPLPAQTDVDDIFTGSENIPRTLFIKEEIIEKLNNGKDETPSAISSPSSSSSSSSITSTSSSSSDQEKSAIENQLSDRSIKDVDQSIEHQKHQINYDESGKTENQNSNNDNSNLNSSKSVIELIPKVINQEKINEKNNEKDLDSFGSESGMSSIPLSSLNLQNIKNQTESLDVVSFENSNNTNNSNVSNISTNISLGEKSQLKTITTLSPSTTTRISASTETYHESVSNIMQVKKNSSSIRIKSISNISSSSSSSSINGNESISAFADGLDETTTGTDTISMTTILHPVNNYSDNSETTDSEISKLENRSDEMTGRIPVTLENVTKLSEKSLSKETERSRKSKGLSSEYRDAFLNNYASDAKNLLTRSAGQEEDFNEKNRIDDNGGNVSSEALQRAYVMDAGTISGICLSVLAICCGVGTVGIVLYRRRFLNKPQALSEPDSSVYIDDSTIRDNSDEMYSLDNDSFLNSLEAMTIQNYWTDTVKHTKL